FWESSAADNIGERISWTLSRFEALISVKFERNGFGCHARIMHVKRTSFNPSCLCVSVVRPKGFRGSFRLRLRRCPQFSLGLSSHNRQFWEYSEMAVILTVSELTRTVRDVLEGHIGDVWVEGEISNYRKQSSGHHYFTLKDDRSQ